MLISGWNKQFFSTVLHISFQIHIWWAGRKKKKKVKEIFKIMNKESPKDENKTRMNSEQTEMKDFRNISTSRIEVNLIAPDSILCTEI